MIISTFLLYRLSDILCSDFSHSDWLGKLYRRHAVHNSLSLCSGQPFNGDQGFGGKIMSYWSRHQLNWVIFNCLKCIVSFIFIIFTRYYPWSFSMEGFKKQENVMWNYYAVVYYWPESWMFLYLRFIMNFLWFNTKIKIYSTFCSVKALKERRCCQVHYCCFNRTRSYSNINWFFIVKNFHPKIVFTIHKFITSLTLQEGWRGKHNWKYITFPYNEECFTTK